MTVPPSPRWGVRFTANPDKDVEYLQEVYDNNTDAAKRGELFLNEPREEIYYVGADGVARTAYGNTPVAFNRIDFTGLREFANDEEAAEASPEVPVGGLYHTAGALRIRLP